MMAFELIGDFELGDGWQCRCGNVYFLAGDLFAKYWNRNLKFHCSKCKRRYTFCEGELRAEVSQPALTDSPGLEVSMS